MRAGCEMPVFVFDHLLWRTDYFAGKPNCPVTRAMIDKLGFARAQTVLHQGYERQNQSCRGSNCPSSELWRTKSILLGLKLSFIRAMKVKINLAGTQTVLHQGYERQNQSCRGSNCPSSGLWKTKSVLPGLKLSFMSVMKDKISLAGAQTVLHQGYERQNQSCRDSNCPSSGLWKTKSVLPGLKLSFIRAMKDKISLAKAQTVLHECYERQNQSCQSSNCPSRVLWKTKSILPGL
jgi:hypothetical protein